MFRTMRGAYISAAATLFLWSCASQGDAPAPAPTPSPEAKAPATLGATSRDTERASLALGVAPLAIEQGGAPRMLRAVGNQPAPVGLTAEAAARHHLARLAPLWLKGGKTADLELIESRKLRNGASLVRFRQRVDGIEIYGGNVAVALKSDGSLISTSGLLRTAAPNGSSFVLAPQQAVARALSTKLGVSLDAGQFALTKSGEFQQLAAPPRTDVRVEAARTKRVYLPSGGKLTPAWFVEYVGAQRGTQPELSYAFIIGASDGSVLREKDLSHDDTVTYRVFAEPTGERRPLDGPIEEFSPHPRGIPDGTYPASRGADLVAIDGFNTHADPWIPPGVTVTTGNNVDAFTDRNGDDLPAAPDVRAEMTSPNAFDYAYDEALEPLANDTQSKAAVVNLFYVINWMHDWWYNAGFDEAAGNAQASNYGRGGVEGDPIRANAQDQSLAGPQGPQRGNANMNTPSDGLSPRMQMFLWQNAIATLQATPGGAVPTFRAAFGAPSFDLTANLVAVDDGSTAGNGTVTDGCQPPVNSVVGAIALVDRGGCNFTVKAKNAQDAGAVGVIIANNAPPFANTPGGADPTVTIPAMGTSHPAGVALRAALSQGPVSVRMVAAVGVERDGDFDNIVIGHEWGHYFHHRLSLCDNQLQCRSLSEGWGDFIALHLMVREGDNYDGTYGVGVFDTKSSSPDPAYLAIRRFPYSVDRTKNALTFRHIADNVPLPTTTPGAPGGVNSQWHNSGEVWASSLWEVYRALLAEHPFAVARQAMAEYVVLGLLLAPPEADYTTTRDAILLAISILNPDDLTIAAEAFASRGLGTCAVAPPPTSTNYNETVEDLGLSAKLATSELEFSDDGSSCDEDGFLDPGEVGTVRFQLANLGTAVAGPVTITATTDTVGVSIEPVTVESLGAFEVEDIELEVRAALDAPTNTALTIVVTASAPETCGDVTSVVASRFGVDEVAGSSRTDSVDTAETSWLTAGEPAGLWFRTPIETGDTVWHGDDFGDVSDVQLVTPPLVVSAAGGAPFTVTFQHRYLFETLFDGGVIELTSDGGTTWVDVSMLGVDPGYTATLLDETGNPIEGRPAFTDIIPSGDFEELALDFTPANLAGQTVQLRFRIGSDGGVGDYGWDIDDIAVTGIDNLPFVGLVPEEGTCQVPPVVDAGPAQNVEGGATVTLAGSASDENDDELTYAWTQVSGTAVTLTGANTLTPSFTAPTVTVDTPLVFELTVSDGFQSASDQVTITVLRPNLGPVVVAGDDLTVDPGAAVTVTGTATDPDDATETLTYAWTQQSGPAVTLTGADTATVSFTAPSPAADSDVVLMLTATDPRGASGSDTVTIHVRRTNAAPVVVAGDDQTVEAGAAVTVTGSATDADDATETLTYVWTQQSGPAVTLTGADTTTVTFTAPSPTEDSDVVLVLTATDPRGATGSDTVTVHVRRVNTAPVVDAGPAQTVDGGDTVTLAGTATDAEGNTLTTEWSLISGPPVVLSDTASLTPTFTAPVVTTAATIVLRLTATDGRASSNDTVEITVNPSVAPDAGVPDAGTPDAGVPPTPDAGGGGGDDDDDDDGCGCSTSSPAAAGNLLLSLAAVLGFLVRRRRR
jgi:MYXO-CTERM domain-containing protein